MARKEMTPEERAAWIEQRDAKLAALHQQITDSVQAITSGDDWAAWLKAGARFHNYSFGNLILILGQNPEATQVAGYRAWQGMGRQVRKGEHGIYILAPRTRRFEVDKPEKAEPETVTKMVGVTAATVFDISQTEGEPLPEGPRPVLVEGQAPEGLIDALEEQIRAAGFTIVPATTEELGRANGMTDYLARTVQVREGLDPAQQAKTTAHELAHVLMHEGTRQGCRGQVEVEAESVAYLVTASQGLDSGGYTFPYVANWVASTPGKDPAKVLEETGRRVMATAKQIITPFDNPPEPARRPQLAPRPMMQRQPSMAM